MGTVLNFKDLIDLPMWHTVAPAPTYGSAGNCFVSDLQDDLDPSNFLLASASAFYKYNVYNDEWIQLASPGLAGTFGAGAGAVIVPSQGPRGVLAAGCTSTKVILSTALPAAVGVNSLGNDGSGRKGFKIRIIGNGAGGSGKIEERNVVDNTGGTTPTLTLDSPLSFTPVAGDGYEFRSGRVYLLNAGTVAAGIWKYYDILTNSFSGNLATANLPATIATDSCFVSLSEDHKPKNRNYMEGFVGILPCSTASTATTITSSQASALVLDNEYRNFQIRIVEDLTNPTAVNQRRRIASHVAASGVFTISSAWTVNPSSNAKFVIENDDDKILLFTSGSTSVFTYNIAANNWDVTTFTARPNAINAGCCSWQSFGIIPDNQKNARHSFIYALRGGGNTAIDVLDIAGGANGAWTAGIVYANSGGVSFTTGTSGVYDAITNKGRFFYLCLNGTQRFYRFDCLNRRITPFCYMPYPQSTAYVGQRLAINYFVDGATEMAFLYTMRQNDVPIMRVAISR